MNSNKDKWASLCVKDKISYLTAFVLIGSGIILAFLSFFLNSYTIASGVLLYIAQCFVIGGGLIGANVYFRSKFIEFDTRARSEIQSAVDRLAKRIDKSTSEEKSTDK